MRNQKSIAPVLVLIAVVLALLYFYGSNTLAFSGFTTTSLSYVKMVSNNASLNGMGWLATINLDGSGNNITGFSAKMLNSSYPTGTPVTITTHVSNYGYLLHYSTAPTPYLYYWNITRLSIYAQAPSCPTGIVCSQNLSSNGEDTFSAIWAGLFDSNNINTAEAQKEFFAEYYAQSCYSAGGIPIILYQTSFGANTGSFQITFECDQISSRPFAKVFTEYTYDNIFNATITLDNGTQSQTLNINGVNGAADIQGQLYAKVVGYSNTGYNINPTSTPTILILTSNNTAVAVNPISTDSQLTGSESSTLPAGTLDEVYSTTENQNVYGNTTLSNIEQLDNQVSSYTFQPVGLSNPFSQINLKDFSQNNPIAFVNLTNTPTFTAQVQIFAKFGTLGIGVPVAQPNIESVSPSPLTVGSAAAVDAEFSVLNSGDASGSVYITGSCNGASFSSYSSPTFINAGSTSQVGVIINSPINPSNSSIEQVPCSAVAFSSSGITKSAPFSFSLSVNPQCAAGTIYENPTTCKYIPPVVTFTTICSSASCAFGNNQTTTITGCVQGYVLNSTTGQCVQSGIGTSTPPTNYTWVYILIAIIIAVAIFFGLKGRTASANSRRR